MMYKKSMDIIDIYAWINNTGEHIINCYIDNIYSSKFYWSLKIRCPGKGKIYMKIEPGTRIHLSKIEPHIKEIDNLTAFLRKHIRNGTIKSLKQLGWERIIEISIRQRNNEYKLIVEIIPRGLLIITSNDGKILYANKFVEMRDRTIKRGKTYTPPPAFINIIEASPRDLLEKIMKGKDIVRGLIKGWGLPGYIAEEILYRAGLYEEKNKKPENIDLGKIVEIKRVFEDLLEEALLGKGYIVYFNNKMFLYTSFEPKLYKELYEAEIKVFDDLNDALDLYYAEYEKNKLLQMNIEKIRTEIIKLEKSIEKQKSIINKYLEESRKYLELYNLLVNNYIVIEEALACAKKVREREGWKTIIEKCPNIIRIDPNKGKIYVKINDIEIPLDIRLDSWNNILQYKIKSNELKKKLEKAKEKLEELRKNLEEKMKQTVITEERIKLGLRPRFWYEKFHWTISSEGFLILAGRDADQNEQLVRKYMEKHDIFLHADIHGAPATIIKTHGRIPSEKTIREAAVIAACYSRAWKEGLGSIDVFWVRAEQVSKTPPSGEYLGKGAFMIYGKKNYLKTELKLSIGVEEICDPIYGLYQRIIVGPEDLVRKKSIVYVELVPGDLRISDASEKILYLFRKILKDHVIGVRKEDVIERLPGPLRILSAKKGYAEPIEKCMET